MDSYRVDVKPVLGVLGESIHVDGSLEREALDVGDEHFGLPQPVRFSVTLSNAGTGIVAMGTVTAHTVATCARCLVEFPLTIEADVDGYYVEPGDTENIPEEQEYAEIDAEGYVDILPALMGALTLEAPFAPLHAEDCAGLCPTCGTDLNTETCHCGSDIPEEHPFAELAGMFADEAGGETPAE